MREEVTGHDAGRGVIARLPDVWSQVEVGRGRIASSGQP